MKRLVYILFLFCISVQSQKAFPTAFGEGASTITGGRGGILFFITTLSTSNIQTYVAASGGNPEHYTGSFSGAFSASNRQIIPKVSGNISGLNLNVSGVSNITYHGHLAPQGGLRLINSTFQMANGSNIIIRHLTVRDGNTAVVAQDDNMFFNRCEDLIVDHVSLAWSGDEGISFFAGTTSGVTYENIIVQNSLIGQGRDGHNRGNITGTVSTTNGVIEATFHGNLWVTFARTPNVTGSIVRAYNGVVYDWLARTTNIAGDGTFDEINRYYKPGPNTVTVGVNMINQFQGLGAGYGTPSIYTAGNIVEGYLTDPLADNRFQIWSLFDNNVSTLLPSGYFRSSPLAQTPADAYTILTAQEGYDRIVVDREIGHNRSTSSTGVPIIAQDAIDDWYTDAVQNGTNPIRTEANFTHPSVASNTPYTDANFDGIYDSFSVTNTTAYNDFEFFSAYMAGDFDEVEIPSNPNVSEPIKKGKKSTSGAINN